MYSCEGRSPNARQRSTAAQDWTPAFAGELVFTPARLSHPVRTLRCPSARFGLGRVPAGAGRDGQTPAVGAGPHGDPRKRADPSVGAADAKSHPCRGTRRARCAVGDGGGRKMRLPVSRRRRIMGRPARARFHRHAAAGGCRGAQRHALLAGAARRHCELERRADALASRERAVAFEPTRRSGAGIAGLGCGTVPGARNAARPVGHRA